MFDRELIGRHQSSWLPEGEGPPPYLGAVGVHRYPLQPLQVQHSYPDLPTCGYRLVDCPLHMLIAHWHNLAKRGGCFQQRPFVCLSVCGFVCLTTRLPSVLCHCWFGGRKGIRPVKN